MGKGKGKEKEGGVEKVGRAKSDKVEKGKARYYKIRRRKVD